VLFYEKFGLGTLRAYKSFYNLSIRRDEILKNDLITNEGIWAICGFPGEFETTEGPQKGFDVVQGYTCSYLFINRIEIEY
jgi:hypothetical protein